MDRLLRYPTSIALLGLILSGCALAPDCTDDSAAANADGQAGRALGIEADEHCRDEVGQAWQQGLSEFCKPENGFKIGHRGEATTPLCHAETFLSAYRLGALLYEKQTEQIAIETEIAVLVADESTNREARLRMLRGRLVVIKRDLPDLITLAQLEGWLPAASVPDQPD